MCKGNFTWKRRKKSKNSQIERGGCGRGGRGGHGVILDGRGIWKRRKRR